MHSKYIIKVVRGAVPWQHLLLQSTEKPKGFLRHPNSNQKSCPPEVKGLQMLSMPLLQNKTGVGAAVCPWGRMASTTKMSWQTLQQCFALGQHCVVSDTTLTLRQKPPGSKSLN